MFGNSIEMIFYRSDIIQTSIECQWSSQRVFWAWL